jgi:hypothetical protein
MAFPFSLLVLFHKIQYLREEKVSCFPTTVLKLVLEGDIYWRGGEIDPGARYA